MKVIKVIVDEIPETCMKCNHCYDNTCEITFKRLTLIRFDSRPDWCPLMSWEEYEKELDAGLDVYLGLDGLIESEE